MAKNRVEYICSNCSEVFNKWTGKCPNCQSWNTLIENIVDLKIKSSLAKELIPNKLNTSNKSDSRIILAEKQLNNLFGDGLVKGSVILLAGAPGIGKTTLLLQLVNYLPNNNEYLYVSGEESINQSVLKLERLKINLDKIKMVSSNSTDDIVATILSKKYSLVVIDSIQTIATTLVGSQTGSMSQITNSASLIINAAKEVNCAVIIVGHITKDGFIAGPKVLEHLVDVVLQFEGERYGNYKILKAIKNRFGSVNEVVIFEMTENGLSIAQNPSKSMLKERLISDGSIVHATLEGNQALLVEIQALVNKSSFGYPKRTTSGFDLNRLNLLIAMLEKRTKLKLSDKDIFINVVGGLSIKDPSADLAVCMAIASGATSKKMANDYVVFGEVGLSGEIRYVRDIHKRFKEAQKLSFKGAIGPISDIKDKNYYGQKDIRQTLIQFLK